jgi:hypothetical protein
MYYHLIKNDSNTLGGRIKRTVEVESVDAETLRYLANCQAREDGCWWTVEAAK